MTQAWRLGYTTWFFIFANELVQSLGLWTSLMLRENDMEQENSSAYEWL